MSVSKAHIKASNKYNAKNYKKIQANIKPNDYNIIDNYCKNNSISKSVLIVSAVKYCINNNIDLSSSSDQDTNSNNNNTADI